MSRRDLADALVEAVDHAGREALVDEEPQPRVARRVHHQHHHPLLRELLLALPSWTVMPHSLENTGHCWLIVWRSSARVMHQNPAWFSSGWK